MGGLVMVWATPMESMMPAKVVQRQEPQAHCSRLPREPT